MNKIDMDNNYFLKIANDSDNNLKNVTSIKKLNISQICKNKVLLLKIDFNTFNRKEYKNILKHLFFIKCFKSILKFEVGVLEDSKILIGYVINYDENNKEHNEFISAVNAIYYNSRYDRYNYIYDNVCNYLDNFFYGKNLCDFKNNKCGEKRNTSSLTGCCHHFKPKWLGPISPKLVLCEHLNNKNYTCDAKCISCKLFTCDYLEKKGVKFRIRDILLLDVFFNPIQKYFIKYMVYTPKEKILKRLMFF